MNAKISVIIICVEAIIYLLLYNLHDCTFKSETNEIFKKKQLYTELWERLLQWEHGIRS